MKDRRHQRLYLITPPGFDIQHFPKMLDRVLAVGITACVQLRLKPDGDAIVGDRDIIDHALAIGPVCADHDVPLLINDRPDLVVACHAQGAHIGKSDMDAAKARAMLGKDAMIGVSCGHSRDCAYRAGEAGADYVAFGPCFTSRSKPSDRDHVDHDFFSDWRISSHLPCVAIGGIDPENGGGLLDHGADFLAVIDAIWRYDEGPLAAAHRFHRLFDCHPDMDPVL